MKNLQESLKSVLGFNHGEENNPTHSFNHGLSIELRDRLKKPWAE